jgi:hypothetical protein
LAAAVEFIVVGHVFFGIGIKDGFSEARDVRGHQSRSRRLTTSPLSVHLRLIFKFNLCTLIGKFSLKEKKKARKTTSALSPSLTAPGRKILTGTLDFYFKGINILK